MNQLESIWNIHQIDKTIKELELEKEKLEANKNIEEILVKLQEKEYDITDLKTQLEVDDIKIQRLNHKIKQITFKLKEINGKLYSGNITNLKKLTNLQDEEKELKKEMSDTEDETLVLLDSIEVNTEKLYNTEQEYKNLSSQYKELEKNNEEQSIEIDNKLQRLKKDIDVLKTDIDPEIYQKYEGIKNKKSKAIAKVDGDKCTGCHMSIPLSVISKIKKGNKLVNCDNCGRILYYESDES